MNRKGGLGLSSAGTCVIAFGFTLLAQPCGVESLGPTGVVCAVPRTLAETAYFLASIGSVLVVAGVFHTGLWRSRIVAEGAWLVIGLGVAVSTLGFVASNILPEVSTVSAEIGTLLGMAGSALLVGGIIKTSFAHDRLSIAGSTGTRWKMPVWSRREWLAFALLTLTLVGATAIGVSIYQDSQQSCIGCGCGGLVTPCPGKEALSMESYKLNSPTNMTLDIRNYGTAFLTLIDYYVKDSAGDQYSSTNWLGPAAGPNALMHANISVDGNAITFQAGNAYTIIVITSRSNQFTFTVWL